MRDTARLNAFSASQELKGGRIVTHLNLIGPSATPQIKNIAGCERILGDRRRGASETSIKRTKKAGIRAGLSDSNLHLGYTVFLGLTRITVAGTLPDAGGVLLLNTQLGSLPAAQAGNPGLICCVSVSVDVFTK